MGKSKPKPKKISIDGVSAKVYTKGKKRYIKYEGEKYDVNNSWGVARIIKEFVKIIKMLVKKRTQRRAPANKESKVPQNPKGPESTGISGPPPSKTEVAKELERLRFTSYQQTNKTQASVPKETVRVEKPIEKAKEDPETARLKQLDHVRQILLKRAQSSLRNFAYTYLDYDLKVSRKKVSTSKYVTELIDERPETLRKIFYDENQPKSQADISILFKNVQDADDKEAEDKQEHSEEEQQEQQEEDDAPNVDDEANAFYDKLYAAKNKGRVKGGTKDILIQICKTHDIDYGEGDNYRKLMSKVSAHINDKKKEADVINVDSDDEAEDDDKGGARDPYPGLYNGEVAMYMKRYAKKGFKGVYDERDLDDVQFEKGKPFSFIVNTNSHFVSVYIQPGSLEYFDPFGDDPPSTLYADLRKLLKRYGDDVYQFKINSVHRQDEGSSNCGWFAQKFLIDRYKGKTFKEATHFKLFEDSVNGEQEIAKFKKENKDFKYIDTDKYDIVYSKHGQYKLVKRH